MMTADSASAAAPTFPTLIQVGSREVEVRSPLAFAVWEGLRQCYDPEIPVNIVDLGLVYDMKLDDSIPGEANVIIRMTLTAPGCGMGPIIAADVKRRVQTVEGVKNVLVDLTFDPPWTTALMSEGARLMLNLP
jgi:metal-sulfur cluster biosynthetic enzyme